MNCWLRARPSRRFLPRTKSNGTSRQKSKRCCGARLAAAAFAIDADVAVLAGSHKSPVAISHLAEAKSRADRSIRQWSRRVLRSVAQLRRRMSGREFARAAGLSIRMESVRNSGAPESRVRPPSIRFSKVWGGGGRPSLVDARVDPCFFHAALSVP